MSELIRVFDCLYGDSTFSEPLSDLISQPVVQRLRDIRLSNIDSLSMPGIANISRYEHSIGVASLAVKLSSQWNLTEPESLLLQAAALLHDSAIPPCGHLVEEALNYLSRSFDHEKQWGRLSQNSEETVGGLDLQIYQGRQAGLQGWTKRHFGSKAKSALSAIISSIRGEGEFGPVIVGEFDIDNLDNVVRAAYHIGLAADRALPGRICDGLLGVNNGLLVVSEEAIPDLNSWLQLRTQLYEQFMLSRVDFVGKAMIIYATIDALRSEQLHDRDWILTDRTYLQRLLECEKKSSYRPVEMWLCHELWALSDLLWFEGKAPSYVEVFAFALQLTVQLGRPCFAYRIKDKRFRQINALTDSGKSIKLGTESGRWLLGVVSPLRKEFTRNENHRITDLAARMFAANCLGRADQPVENEQSALFSEAV